MNKFLFTFSILILNVCLAHAQSVCKNSAFSPENEEFLVDVPGTMSLPGVKDDDERFYAGNFCDVYFFIASDVLATDKRTRRYELISNFAKVNKALTSKETLDGLTGDVFEFTDPENFHHRILAISAKKRFYIFHTVAEKKDSVEAESFFSSIKLNKTLPQKTTKPVKNTTEKSMETATKQNKNSLPTGLLNEIGAGSGNGRGWGGIGSGSNSGIGGGEGRGAGIADRNETDPSDAPKKIGKTSPVKILFKQQAKYTDLARLYGIEGRVSLRVTFLANGTIGAITPVKKLPFGLTDNAITAAKSIRFEPAVKNDVPYAVAKTVLFTFTIY